LEIKMLDQFMPDRVLLGADVAIDLTLELVMGGYDNIEPELWGETN
jgi:hypothetical protein